MERVSILTPYTHGVTQAVHSTFTVRIQVDRLTGLGLSKNSDVTALDPMTVAEHAGAALDPRLDGLVIMCTNLRSMEIEPGLERSLGKAVITVNAAVTRVLTRILGR